MSREPHLEHFGLREPPFQLAPDPDYLYLSTQHSLAQAYLSYALLNRDTFVVLTGETGTGKTTLVNRLIASAGERAAVARIAHSQLTPVELLQSVLLGFGIRAFDKQKVELLTLLGNFFDEQHAERRQALIVVDDAHNLAVDVLEEVRLLTQLGTHKDATVNLVLSGRPSLRETLELPVLDQLRQRMRFSFRLEPLSAEETGEYIQRRLDVAGAGRALFTPDCIPMVMRYTAGIPRLINILCDTALMSAFAEGAPEVTAAQLQAAVEELDWAPHRDSAAAAAREAAQEEEALDADDLAVLFENTPAFPALQDDGDDDEPPATIAPFAAQRSAGEPHAQRGPRQGPRGGDAAGAPEVRATFTVLVDGRRRARHRLTADRLTIGRDRDNDIQIPAEYVSRHHAQVSWLRGGCWISDLNSTNGTFVNGLRVRRRLLRDGDEIQFGRYLLHVSCGAPSAEAVAADADDLFRETLIMPEEHARKA